MSNQCFEQNIAIIARRWPALLSCLQQAGEEQYRPDVQLAQGQDSTLLINGVQLTSRHNRAKEAQLQSAKLPAAARIVTLYGTGLGDLQQLLLSSAQLRQLTVCIMNEYVFALVLQLLDQRHWLSDERVQLQLGGAQQDIQLPFVVSPAELVLASDKQFDIRDRLTAELDADYVAQQVMRTATAYLPRLSQNKAYWQNDLPVQQLFNAVSADQPVFVLASGPSLELCYNDLRRARQHSKPPLLIAVDTAVTSLLDQQIVPDIVVTMDPKIGLRHIPFDRLPITTALVYFPLVNPDLLTHFAGKRYVALSQSKLFDGIRTQLHADTLFIHGSVLHPAVDLAVKMGARQLVLFGADFAFSCNKTHAGWQDKALGPGYSSATEWVENALGEKVPTLRNLLTYRLGLERYIQSQPAVQFFNASKVGAVIAGTAEYPE
ncbi:MAG TPA: 6-hydroxymethylpterin diphosphokinase MptE-like protein [Rheinheimera sp.]|nr:6-hydroxymethylpterin diphosphokinase MptE-like protein [Rheinheimera sp.]